MNTVSRGWETARDQYGNAVAGQRVATKACDVPLFLLLGFWVDNREQYLVSWKVGVVTHLFHHRQGGTYRNRGSTGTYEFQEPDPRNRRLGTFVFLVDGR